MNQSSLKGLQPWLRPYAEWLVSLGPYAGCRSLRITSVRRSRAQQAALYLRFLRGLSQFPAAPPGQSKHEHGLAWDMVTEPYSCLGTLGAFWRQAGGTWSPKDPIHFEV